jgi:para-aminobenzoate synthetase/4-amino-4-deoxychorismate lyase
LRCIGVSPDVLDRERRIYLAFLSSHINQVVLRDAVSNSWLQFDSPREIVEAYNAGDVMKGLRRIEDAVSERGLYAAGMMAYEAAPAFDSALTVLPDGAFPLLWFGLYDQPREMEIPKYSGSAVPSVIDWNSSVSPDEYRRAFEKIKDYIQQGDTYQVNYTLRLLASFSADPWSFFIRLLAAQGPTYGAFMDTGNWIVCSASPELFFRLDGTCIESRPMKGTAARGLTLAQDRGQMEALKVSKKDRAENLMIVDMVRNDMGRIADDGSVHVTSLFDVEKYPTLLQMTSTVRAETRASYTEIFRAMFPPASITGAPKSRTMQIIAELETTPRRVYTGSIGFIAPGRHAQFNVAIRSLLINREDGRAEYGVGGGIVWDSDCAMEQLECRTKSLILNVTAEPFSLLETMLWTPDTGYYLIERHLKRLEQSAEYFDYPIDKIEIRRQLLNLSESLPNAGHKVRLLVSAEGHISCQAQTVDLSGTASPKNVVIARSPVDKLNPFLYHKTTNRRIYEDALSACPGYDDVILYNEAGEVTESTIANLVVDINGSLYTPPVSCGLLPGTYREWMLEMKMVEERPITVEETLASPDVYLVNSVRGMYSVKVLLAGCD